MNNVPERDSSIAAAPTAVSLIIAVFNSEISLRRLHQAIIDRATSPEFDFEIVYVDDGSTDGSLEILHDLKKNTANVVVVEHPGNRGQSRAVLTGIHAAHSPIVVTLDDDLQHNPADVARLLAVLKAGGPGNLVMGVADALKRPLWRAWAGLCANAVSNLFLARPLPLKLTTFCAFRRQLCADLDPGSDRDLPLVTALVQAADVTRTIPVQLDSLQRDRSRYDLAALFRLFMSRSRYYKFSRVLAALAGASFLMLACDALLLTQDVAGHPILTALLLVFTATPWLLLALLTIRVGRDADVPALQGANRSA